MFIITFLLKTIEKRIMKFDSVSLSCPICDEKLEKENKTLHCSNGHSFDLAKEGYVNLLLSNQKKSKNPGDNKLMSASRREFLNSGAYFPLVERVTQLINLKYKNTTSPLSIVDAGCGEGYYMDAINKLVENTTNFIGFDMSKDAIKLAAKRYKEIDFFVASINNVPILSTSTDCIISIFSPINVKEFSRILKDDGILITVTPNKKHLSGLANIIYDKAKEHDSKIGNLEGEYFDLEKNDILTFTLNLDNNKDIMNLFRMTPYYYSSSKEKSEKVNDLTTLETTIDFEINIFRKK
ncbi:methyltransferase domain-containing protein [Flammeovirga kamogawensis]|nr:methyltransferase domain-containing protein [Flammeovirga kamogawensis]